MHVARTAGTRNATEFWRTKCLEMFACKTADMGSLLTRMGL